MNFELYNFEIIELNKSNPEFAQIEVVSHIEDKEIKLLATNLL